MGAAENDSFRDFVSSEQAGLLRLAILLAGDRGHAEDLVQIALMKSYRHWARISCHPTRPLLPAQAHPQLPRGTRL